MTRLEYTNRLRDAGFTVRPGWQARSQDAESGYDLTCYAVYAQDGVGLTNIMVRQLDHGIEVFFASTNNMIEADIAQLRRLARSGVAA